MEENLMIELQSRIDRNHFNSNGNSMELVARGWLRLHKFTTERIRVKRGLIFKKFVESKQTNTEWEIITKGVDLRNSDSLRELAEDLRKKVSLRSLDLPPDVSKFIEEGLEVKIGEIFEDDVKSQSFTERETPGVVNWFT